MFGFWLSATTEEILTRNLADKADSFREKTLKYRVLRGLLTFLNHKQTIDCNLKMSINTSLGKLIQNCFQNWKFISVYNKNRRLLYK